MRIVTYLGFTLLSVLIQFSVMDFIQSIMQLDEKLIDATNASSKKRQLRDVLKDLSYKPHALYYRKQINKIGKDVSAKIYDNTSLPDLLLTTTESGAAGFEILYDDSTSATDEDTTFTTEVVATSTELDNVTEITFFENTNQTAAKPNVKPKKKTNKDCNCNFLHEVCDINCCCDVECSEVELSMFLNCTKNKTTSFHDDGVCYSPLFHFGHDGPLSTVLNDWLCIVKTNLPDRPIENKKIYPLASNNYFMWKDIEKTQLHYEFTNKIYEYGDPIWLIKNGSIYYIDLPAPVMNGYCTGRKTIQFLKNDKFSCLVKIGDLEMFQIMKISEKASVISATPLSMNNTFMNCSSLHCINWTLIICDENLVCVNYNESVHEPICTESICTNLALKIEYIFNYHDSKITNATLKFHVQNAPINLLYMKQEIDVKFVLSNASIEHVLKLSGNPGYIDELPVIVSYAESNYTDNFFNKSSQLKHLTLLENRSGTCWKSNLTDNIVLFGINRRIKCKYHHKYTKLHNVSDQCQSIQNNINMLYELRNNVVSPLGDPTHLKDNDWIPMVMNVSDNAFVYGEVREMSSKLYCYNIVTRYSLIFSYAEINGNNRILEIKFGTTSRNASFNLEDISVVVTIDIDFVDVSRPSAIQYSLSPSLYFHLPNDFFLPFPSNESQVVSLDVLCLILYCCVAILASK